MKEVTIRMSDAMCLMLENTLEQINRHSEHYFHLTKEDFIRLAISRELSRHQIQKEQ